MIKKLINYKKIEIWNKHKKIWGNFKKFFFWRKTFYSYIIKKAKIWQSFKRFFLWKKKINFLSRFSWLFNNLRILNRHYLKVYNFKNKKKFKAKYKLCLKNPGFKSYNFLSQLEFRIDLILVKVYFSTDIKKSQQLIFFKKVFINNIVKTQANYVLQVNDLLSINNLSEHLNWTVTRKKIFCRKRRWYKYNMVKKFKFKLLFKNTIKNFIEINYRIGALIYIRLLFNNEILKHFKLAELNFRVLKKFWHFS